MTAHPYATAITLGAVALAIALVALGLAILALWRTRRAVNLAHQHTRRRPEPVEERQANLGPSRVTGERRAADLGPSARHRHPDDERSTRRQAQAVRDGDDEYPPRPTPRPVDEPATIEHAPPTADMRRLPPPGSITR